MAKNENAVAMFEPGAVPDFISKFNETESNIKARANGDTLTYKGKVFTVTQNGSKQVLMKKDENGDEEPRTTIPVIILGFADRRGRSMYEGGYNDATPSAPTCWSKNGIKPDDEVAEKQAAKCATCPMSAKGSKVSDDGRETKACQEHLYVAVQLYRKWDTPPLRLRLAITSIYDAKGKAQQEKGWYAFDQYRDMLLARGVRHSASVVTRLKFDPDTAYPKVLFSNASWLASQEELDMVTELSNSDVVKALVNPVFEGAAAEDDKTPTEDREETGPKPGKPVGAKPATTAKPTPAKPTPAKPKPAPVQEPEDDETGDEAGETGEVVTEGGEDATDVTDLVEQTEDDDEEAAIKEAEAKAKALADKKAARIKAEAEAAAKAAKARKAAPAEDDDTGDGETIKVTPPKAPKGGGTIAAAPPPAAGGKVVGGKPAAPKGTPAGKTPAVSSEVTDIIDDW